jgi:hypothetical protein
MMAKKKPPMRAFDLDYAELDASSYFSTDRSTGELLVIPLETTRPMISAVSLVDGEMRFYLDVEGEK